MRAFKKLYFGYGANTNKEAMAVRCPDAEALGIVSINDHRLVFRGVADVEPFKGSRVCGALWEITPEDEAALDHFEGFPNLYIKTSFPLVWEGVKRHVMLYIMRTGRREYALPSGFYEQTLRDGYGHFGIGKGQLNKAIRHARQCAKENWGASAPPLRAVPSRWSERTKETWGGNYLLPNPTGYTGSW